MRSEDFLRLLLTLQIGPRPTADQRPDRNDDAPFPARGQTLNEQRPLPRRLVLWAARLRWHAALALMKLATKRLVLALAAGLAFLLERLL